jgi:coenzyme F420-reducing hydrogenase beta subunit
MRKMSKNSLNEALEQVKKNGHISIGTQEIKTTNCYYGYSMSEHNVRKKSSSGGIFYELSQKVIQQGGVVFGAVYDRERQIVVHKSTLEVDLQELMRSKYVESKLDDTFSKISTCLKERKIVLFAGTPCQAAGLRKYIKMQLPEYEDLIFIIDFLCEGVPSRKILSAYRQKLENKYNSKISRIIFRSKSYGWDMHCIKAEFINGKNYIRPSFSDSYMHTFIMDLIFNRPSCYTCKFREEKKSDITLADFWKVAKVDSECNDNKGVSI